MNLRIRLIVAFFLLSIVPLGTVTLYTYASNAAAMREAAGREAQLLAGELTDRMKLVMAQLSQQFEQLMEIPASARVQAPAAAAASAGLSATQAAPPAQPASPVPALDAAALGTETAARVAAELGEVAILLNNIEVFGFGRGRGGRGDRRDLTNEGPPDSGGRRFGLPGAREGRQGPPPDGVNRPFRGLGNNGPPPEPSGDDPARGGRGAGAVERERGPDAAPSTEDADLARIQIDLGPLRREILQQIFPDRERFDQLSSGERELILGKVNERMLGIQEGIQLLQQKATERAADASRAASLATEGARAASTPSRESAGQTPAAGAPGQSSPPPAPAMPAAPAAPVAAAPPPPPLQRETALAGSRMDVRVTRNGQVVGQVNADINLPNLLATVFTTTRRDKGEVPFAIGKNGEIYTPTDGDRAVITGLDTTATRPDTPPGTQVLPNWVVVTTADPTGSELKFGIARPIGTALDDLRRSSARNAGLGLGLIGLALIGIVPLSSRLTRNLSRLSDGVNQIAAGDYRARVDVPSHDEIGKLAGAFNRMAAEVERHQRSAVEQERLRRELELGRQIQHDMLPQAPLRLGLTEIRGVSVPATEVGGDFFNYFQTTSGKIALVVGDVSGKGVGAALLMANIQASLRTRLALGQDLASLARELDADIGASTPGSVYATLFVGLLDPNAHTLDYVNAGHNPQFVLRSAGGLERMESTGLPIGLLVGHEYKERRIALVPGDVLFFYTDGCVEAENSADEMFGADRLEALLLDGHNGSGDDTLQRVEREIARFRSGREPFDDATMMVVNVG
jgi:serine phosphatase RsbU (regulator of sigma subunit)